MNVRMAIKMAERAGLKVQTVVATDDVASAPKSEISKRRGKGLDDVIRLARKTIDQTRSVGIGLSSCVIPVVGKANFTIPDGQMEVGIGHHGEPGIQVTGTRSAHDLADLLLDIILPDLPIQRDDEVARLVSELGATPVMEQYILYGELARRLAHEGIHIHCPVVGNLFTSLEMMGVTVTLLKLDDELKACLDAPCASVGLTLGE